MIITREMLENASSEQLQKWRDAARWYFFTFRAKCTEEGYRPGEFEKWVDIIFPLYRQNDTPPSDELLEWYSTAVTMHMAADEPKFQHPPRSGGIKHKE